MGLSLLLGVMLVASFFILDNLPAIYLILFLSLTLLYFYRFHLHITQVYLLACFYVFHEIVLKGVVVGCISLFFKKNSFLILSDPTLALLSEIVVQILLYLMLVLYSRGLLNIKNIRNFMVCKKQLLLVLTCHLTISIFLLFNSFSFYYNLDLVWISVSQIMVGVILYVIYMVILNYGVNVADLLQHKIRDKNQMEAIKQQLIQQNSLSKIEKVLNQFKHDYREQMLSVEYCIENDLKQEALEELKKDILQMLSVLPSSKKYSNNLILNSLLIEKQAQCDALHINMIASLYTPLDLMISENQCHEIFRIMIQNAIEGNEKVAEENRYLTIKSDIEKQWLSVLIENPYDGEISFENSRPVPSRSDEDKEGLGLIYVEEVLSEVDGFIRYEANPNTKIFKVIILIPVQEQ